MVIRIEDNSSGTTTLELFNNNEADQFIGSPLQKNIGRTKEDIPSILEAEKTIASRIKRNEQRREKYKDRKLQSDATYFMEVDRLLRPGGYLVISGPPVQ